jgi:hypothetical protein
VGFAHFRGTNDAQRLAFTAIRASAIASQNLSEKTRASKRRISR